MKIIKNGMVALNIVYITYNYNNNSVIIKVSVPLRQIITSKWLDQSSSKSKSANKINTSLGLVDTNKDEKHAKHQNSKCTTTVYTKETKQNIKK